MSRGPGRAAGCAGRIRHPKKRAMLAALSKLGNVTGAARLVGINRDTHYSWTTRLRRGWPESRCHIPGGSWADFAEI
jgi:hypothetical protein